MIVLDVSAAVEIARGTIDGQAIRSLFEVEEEIIAPSLFETEVTNVAWKYARSGAFTKEQARQLQEDARTIVDRFIPDEDLVDEAFGQALFYDHSAYDMVYLVLARRYNATLVTLDEKLSTLCCKCGVSCITAA